MDSLRSNKSKRDQRSFDSSRPAGWLLAVFVGLPLLQSTPVAAQISPATLPDLKLALAGRALAIALQEDGKVIIGGDFTGVNGVPRKSIARLNPNGSVDATWNPNVSWVGGASQGTVETIAVMGTNVFVGGYFLEVGGQSRVGIAKLTETGSVDPTWNAGFSLADPQYAVATMAVSGTNLYVGGPVRIRSVEGHNITNIFKVNTITGTIDETWAPNPNGLVRQLVVHDGWVYAGGDFTSISGQGTRYLARLHPITGAVDATWVPDPNDRIFAIAISGDDAFVAGSFSTIGGLNKNRLAKLSTLGGGSTDNAWSPNPSGSFNLISALAISDGRIYIGGSFTSIGGQSRSNVARLDMTGTGLADPIWNPNCDGAVGDIAVSGADIYLGGGFASIAEVDSFGAAKVNSATGSPDKSFNARLELPGQAAAIAIQSDRKVIVGGSFISAGGLPRRNLVRLNPDGTMDLAWAPNPNGTVVGLAVSGSDIFVSGGFTRIGGLNRMRLAKLSARSDAADAQWDPAPSDPFGPRIDALAVDGSNLYVGGTFTWIGGQRKISLAKLSTTGTGAADPMWSPNPMSSNPNYPSGLVSSLALSGSDIFVGGLFYLVGGQSRNDLAKLSTTGTGSADPSWNPNPNAFVEALAVSGTNIFVAGGFSIIGGQSISNLAKLSTLGTGEADPTWDPSPDNDVHALAVADVVLYAGGVFQRIGGLPFSGLARLSISGNGSADPSWNPNPRGVAYVADLAASGKDLYVGGLFTEIGGVSRHGFAFLPVAYAPQLIQDTSTSFFIVRNPEDGPEVTHFRITGVTGGGLYRSNGVTPVNVGDFMTVAEGSSGLKFVPGGTITAVSALNNTLAGASAAESSLTMSTNPSPVIKFSATTYSVREGQGNIVVTVRKFGSGAATVAYFTSDLTATKGLDYQTASNTLSFSGTDKAKNLIITIADDLMLEDDEQFAVTLTNVSVGALIAGPATAIVTIVDNDIVGVSDSLTGTVSPASPPVSTGVLAVSLQPTNANGQWRLLGELNWHDSGASVAGLVTGNYGVEFRPVNGYFQPQTVTVPISVSVSNIVTFFYAVTTNLETGTLSMIIKPDDVATATDTTLRGQWRRQGRSTNWLNTGDVVPNLNAGSYTVEFKPVAGRSTPLPQIVQVGGADAIYSGVGTYLFGSLLAAQTPTVVPFHTATTSEPYLYNGQIQTSVGFGSGFVVKPRVVLTAAHVLFDDVQLTNVTGARWFFQRYHDQLEPVPQVPRGWYIFEGYASQRQLDNSPGLSTPASQNLDAAALYFLEDAGRGGYGGYLSSDADNNEYLLSANNKFLVGYPLEGVSLAEQGKLFATMPGNLTFTRLYTSIFATTNIQSFPGNSGGPLYVQADVDKYLPAAICLGGSGETLVRAINSEVVDLINRAEISGNGGGNIIGGGVTLLSPGITAPPFGTGLLTVSMAPSNALSIGYGWRIAGYTDTNYVTDAVATVALIGGGSYPIEFKPVPGFLTPSNRTVLIAVGGVVTLQADYVPIRPVLSFDYINGLSLSGATGATYRVEVATDLAMPIAWTPLTNLTLINFPFTVSDTHPTRDGGAFYRAVLVP